MSTRSAPLSAAELLDPPRYGAASISPDGRRVAFLSPWRTRLNVWVADIPEHGSPADVDLETARRVTADDHRPILDYRWPDDVRVVQAESDAMVEALRARGVEVEYRVFADEGHLFANPENLVEMVETSGRFLAEHLGGRP